VKTAYLSLGSNLGDRAANIERGLELLENPELHVVRRSALYETEPQEMRAQPWFLNIVAAVETSLYPRQLLSRIAHVEREMGRQRVVHKGPRTLDIDILLFGTAIIDMPDLVIPHPAMAARRFVLVPLAEIAPDLRHPVLGRTIRDLLADIKGQEVRRSE
jgi:2-amino-4-hydroxy-6-hydroxymethyldihydropteridine diphosphokinase